VLTKNNWLTSNLDLRRTAPATDLSVNLNPYLFESIDFDKAAELTAIEIADSYQNLYLGLSGGMDSVYILKLLHRLSIPIIPVIAMYGNHLESRYAVDVCKELNIDLVVINMTDEQFKEYFYEIIYKKINGVGLNNTQALLVAEYVKKNNGVLITGNHFMGDGDEIVNPLHYANTNEWDFYVDFLDIGLINIDLFLYTPQIAYSMLPKTVKPIEWDLYKSQLYNLPYRRKLKSSYSDDVWEFYRNLFSRNNKFPKSMFYWSKSQFDNIFDFYVK
jgi:hypothetical protein